jgi:hypothetical protein
VQPQYEVFSAMPTTERWTTNMHSDNNFQYRLSNRIAILLEWQQEHISAFVIICNGSKSHSQNIGGILNFKE